MKHGAIFLILIMCLSSFFMGNTSQSFGYFRPQVECRTDSIFIKVDMLSPNGDYFIFYRTDGLNNFQIRQMKREDSGRFYFQLSTQNLYGKKLEYFIIEDLNKVIPAISPLFTIENISNKESPDIYFQETTLPSTDTPQKRTPFYQFIKTNLSLSTNTQLYDHSDNPDAQKYTANGNITFSKNINNEKYELDFKSDFSYTNPVYDKEKESPINLSSMNLRFKTGAHQVEAGDLYVSEVDFTTASINRRGMKYDFKSKYFLLSSFYTNSQQKTKFEGFGFPPGGANYFCTSASFQLGQEYNPVFKLRGLFLSGRDNLDSKTIISTDEMNYSQGDMFALSGQLNLFNTHLGLKGEYVSSNFGKGIDANDIDKQQDEAWFARAEFNYGILRADVDYREIGSQFNSIANLFFQNDNKGIESNLFLTVKTFNLHFGYADKKKNLLNTELMPMLHTKFVKGDFSWIIANRLSLGGEYSFNNLDYDKSTGFQTGSQDMDTISYAGNIAYRAGYNGITLRLGKTESKTFTSNIDGSVAINLQLGKFFRFDPTVSYQSMENFVDDSLSKIYNLFINTELTFVPQLLSITATGSFRYNDNSIHEDETTWGGTVNLNLYMAKIFKNKLSPTLMLKSRYDERRFSGIITSNFTLFVQADIAF